MPSDTIKMGDREGLEESIRAAFAKPVGESAGQLVPAPTNGGGMAIVTAQKVAVERDEARILARIRVMAQAAGEDWFYRYPTRNQDGSTGYIEGPSIKCANNVARMYGNCEVDTRVVDNGDSWIIYAKFADYETGFAYTRPFQQRKNQRAINAKDGGRLQEIALQIGISKSIRNVITNALETFTNFAFEEAKAAIVGRIGAKIEYYRDRVLHRLAELKVDVVRVDAVVGRASKDWLAPDIARVIAQLQAINDGMATVDETWPTQAGQEKPAEARPTRDQFTKTETKTEEPFIITDMRGEEFTMAGLDHAVDAYRSILDAAEKQGEKALGTAIDNNGPFFSQLDERGHTDLSRELSLEGGKRREAARPASVPRGTSVNLDTGEVTEDELRSKSAAERPGADESAPPASERHQGDPSPAGRDTAPHSPSPAGPSQSQQKGETVLADQLHAGPLNQNATVMPAGEPSLEDNAPLLSDTLLAKRRRELRGE